MSLGVLNNLNAISAQNNLNNTSASLSTVLGQLSSGSKINSGADDAAGLSLVNGLQANSMALTQSKTNASEGVGLLTVADGALSQVTSLLNRAVTLATEASNGTLISSQDTAANQEYQSILSEVSNIGSTTTYNGTAVFGSTTSIYTGASSTAGASVNQLNIRSLSSSNVGDSNGVMAYTSGSSGGSAFIDLSSGGVNAASTDSLGSATSLTTTLAVNYMTTGANGSAVQGTANITVGSGTSYSNTAQGMINAINGSGLGLTASFGTAAQAGATSTSAAGSANVAGGGSTDTGIIISGSSLGTGTGGAGAVGTLTVAATSDTLGGSLAITGSNGTVHTVTLGTANSTDTLANLAATINSADYGVTASVNTSVVDGNAKGTVLSFTSASSAVSVAGTGVTDAAVSTTSITPTVTNPVVTAALHNAGTATMGTITVGAANQTLGGSITLYGAKAAGGAVAALQTMNTGSGTAISSAAGVITLGIAGATDTLANLANTINNNQATGANITASLDSTGTIMTITNTATVTLAATVTNDFSAQTESNSGNAISLTGTPTVSGTASSSVIGTLTGLTSASAYNQTVAGTLNIGSNAGITLGNSTIANGPLTDTLAHIASTVNAGKYGVTASLNTAGTVLSFSSANSADTFSVTGGSVVGTKGSITSTTNVANQNQMGTVTITGSGVDATDVLTNTTSVTVGGQAFAATGNETLTALAATITAANKGYTAAVTVGTGTGAAASETMTITSNSAATLRTPVTTTLAAASGTAAATTDSPSTTSSAYYTTGISGSVADTTTGGGTLNTGVVSNATGSGGVATTSYSDTAGVSLSSTDLSTQADAQAALSLLNKAVTAVSAQDGYIGAQINQLNAVSSVLSTQAENVTAAQNAVQATDYASATSNMSKYEILSQTGISALAQANSVQQEVTKLLQ